MMLTGIISVNKSKILNYHLIILIECNTNNNGNKISWTPLSSGSSTSNSSNSSSSSTNSSNSNNRNSNSTDSNSQCKKIQFFFSNLKKLLKYLASRSNFSFYFFKLLILTETYKIILILVIIL